MRGEQYPVGIAWYTFSGQSAEVLAEISISMGHLK